MGALPGRLKRAGLLQARYLERLALEAEERRRQAEEVGEAVRDEEPDAGPPHVVLLRLCDAGALVGGLTVELDVRPDELFGPLVVSVGGKARLLRVIDVVDGPPLRLTVSFEGHEEQWELEDLYPFVLNVNDLLKDDRSSKAVAILGEWEDSLQLWCVEKARLAFLLGEDWFHPRNRHQLEGMVGR